MIHLKDMTIGQRGFIIDIDWDGDKKCPVCGNLYVRPSAVYVVCGDTQISITGEKEIQIKSIPSPVTRGVIVYRDYGCEGGHQWREVERFHKGNTYMETIILPDWDDIAPCLWRN